MRGSKVKKNRVRVKHLTRADLTYIRSVMLVVFVERGFDATMVF